METKKGMVGRMITGGRKWREKKNRERDSEENDALGEENGGIDVEGGREWGLYIVVVYCIVCVHIRLQSGFAYRRGGVLYVLVASCIV